MFLFFQKYKHGFIHLHILWTVDFFLFYDRIWWNKYLFFYCSLNYVDKYLTEDDIVFNVSSEHNSVIKENNQYWKNGTDVHQVYIN